jgi:hypothetical protein
VNDVILLICQRLTAITAGLARSRTQFDNIIFRVPGGYFRAVKGICGSISAYCIAGESYGGFFDGE